MGVKKLVLFGNGRVMWIFHREIIATNTMKLFHSVIYNREKVFSFLELPYPLFDNEWWAIKNLILLGYGRVLRDFHRKTRPTITINLFFLSSIHEWEGIRLLGTAIRLLVTKWWAFINLILFCYGRFLALLTGKREQR